MNSLAFVTIKNTDPATTGYTDPYVHTGSCDKLIEENVEYSVIVGTKTIKFIGKSELVDSISLTYIGDSYKSLVTNEDHVADYGFVFMSLVAEGYTCVLRIYDLDKFMQVFGIASASALDTLAFSVTYEDHEIVKIPTKYLPIQIVSMQEGSLASIDFSKYDPGEYIFLAHPVDQSSL